MALFSSFRFRFLERLVSLVDLLYIQGISFVETTVATEAPDATTDAGLSSVDNETARSQDEVASSGEPEPEQQQVFSVAKNLLKSDIPPTSSLKSSNSSSTARRESRLGRNVSFKSPPPKMQRLSTTSVDFNVHKT